MGSGLTVVSTTNKVFNLSLYDRLTEASLVRARCGLPACHAPRACMPVMSACMPRNAGQLAAREGRQLHFPDWRRVGGAPQGEKQRDVQQQLHGNGCMRSGVKSTQVPQAGLAGNFLHTGAARRAQVIDVGKFTPGQELPQGLLWVAEQVPGLIVAADMTDTLARGYFAAYNIPVFPEARATFRIQAHFCLTKRPFKC